MLTIHTGLWQNGKNYWVTGTCIDQTNRHYELIWSNTEEDHIRKQFIMVLYEDEDGNKHCREVKEFLAKFTKVKLTNDDSTY